MTKRFDPAGAHGGRPVVGGHYLMIFKWLTGDVEKVVKKKREDRQDR